MRRYLTLAVVLALCSAPLSAELKVTNKMTARQVAGAAPANDMMAAMVGPMIQQVFGGAEGIEMTVTMNEDGRMRVDYASSFSGMPAGAAVITKADGSSVGFDAKAKTWWKVPDAGSNPQAAAMLAQLKPEFTTKRTGEFATVAGLKAERVTLAMRMAIPRPEGTENLPPEMLAMIPTELSVDSDMWLANVHVKYSKAMAKVLAQGPMAGMGLEKMMGDLTGLNVRNVSRMSMLPGYEIETVALKIVEEDVPDSVFDVPAGFKEIPMPMPNIR